MCGRPMARALLRLQFHRGHSPIIQFSKVLSTRRLLQHPQPGRQPTAQIPPISSTARPSTRPETSTPRGRHQTLAPGCMTSGSPLRMITARPFMVRSESIRAESKETCRGSLPATMAGLTLSTTEHQGQRIRLLQ